MFEPFYRLLSINELNSEAKQFILKSSMTYYLFTFLIYFAQIFIILFSLTIVTLDQLAILLATMMIVEAIIAIPAGTLGDVKGQKYILICSSISYALSYYFLVRSTSFDQLILVFVFLGLASALDLENFYSFFDNNYQFFAYEDIDRNIYLRYNSKFFMLKMIISSISLFSGAVIASNTNRLTIFNIVIYGLLFSAIIKFFLLKDHKNIKRKGSFLSILPKIGQGLKYASTNIRVLLFIIGSVIVAIVFTLWESLFSIILYHKIGTTDQWTGFINAAVILITAILIGVLGFVSSKFKIKSLYQLSAALSSLVFFGGLIWFLNNITFPGEVDFGIIIAFLLTLVVILIPYQLSDLLYYLIIMDITEDKYRGQIYSIIPAVRGLVGAALLFFGSAYLSANDLAPIFSGLLIIGFIGSLIIITSLVGYRISTISTSSLSFFSSYLLKRNLNMSHFLQISTHESVMIHEDKIKRILERLTQVALRDSFVTEDEKTLLEIISSDIQAYITILGDYKHIFLVGDKIDKEEKKEKKLTLLDYKKRIWDNAYTFSMRETGISEDLTNILFELSTILKYELE